METGKRRRPNSDNEPSKLRRKLADTVWVPASDSDIFKMGDIELLVFKTKIPPEISQPLYDIWLESSRVRKEFGFSFSIRPMYSLIDGVSGTAIQYGNPVDKSLTFSRVGGAFNNFITGTRNATDVPIGIMSGHTHLGPVKTLQPQRPNSTIMTLPSGKDLRLYMEYWPAMQINLILDVGGIMVVDFDPVAFNRVKPANVNKSQFITQISNEWEMYVTQSFPYPIQYGNNHIRPAIFADITNTELSNIKAQFKKYGINLKFYTWDSILRVGIDIPITLEFTSDQLKNLQKVESSKLNIQRSKYSTPTSMNINE